MRGNMLLINISSKVWRSKVINTYIPVDYSSDINEAVFDYKYYGEAAFRPMSKWKDVYRQNIISYHEDEDDDELHAHIAIGDDTNKDHKSTIMGIVKKNTGIVLHAKSKTPYPSFEYLIDTSTAKLVC